MQASVRHNNRKALLFAGAWILLAASAATAQESALPQPAAIQNPDTAGPAFEVATVRPTNRENRPRWTGTKVDASGQYAVSALSLSWLVRLAYLGASSEGTVTTDRGLPKWVSSDEFDISARVDEADMRGWGQLTNKQRQDLVRPMVQRLLTERFHLKLRVETRDTPVYALVQAKGGAHVKEVPTPPEMDSDRMPKWMAENPGKPVPGVITCSGDTCTATAVKISDATGQIQGTSQADRMVIDETGLKGYYDFSFKFTSSADESPMHRMEEDLGMKFVPRTVPMKSYVIESAEKPSLDGP
jgi:uncharacterized protein (TIGR03435 family)